MTQKKRLVTPILSDQDHSGIPSDTQHSLVSVGVLADEVGVELQEARNKTGFRTTLFVFDCGNRPFSHRQGIARIRHELSNNMNMQIRVVREDLQKRSVAAFALALASYEKASSPEDPCSSRH